MTATYKMVLTNLINPMLHICLYFKLSFNVAYLVYQQKKKCFSKSNKNNLQVGNFEATNFRHDRA